MTRIVHFTVWGPGWGLAPEITNPEQYKAFRQKAADLGFPKATINCPPDHPYLPTLLTELEGLGWRAYHGYIPPELKPTHFQLRTIVEYEESEIEAADLLCLSAWAEWHITSFARRNGKRWVGHAGHDVGHLTGEGWNQTHGVVDGWRNYFVHPKVRAHFEKAGLQLIYHPLEWDKPELAQGEFWEIDTPHVMPPCLNDMITWEDGARVFEDGGCEPVELRFRRSEVAAMGDFDAAWTREEVGKPNDPRDGGHHLIVSQRFRRACLDYPLEHVSFVPVRLVDS
ncbi:MAG: hypothetical protein U1F71_04760 [Verrucomicrobiaceae bacterium]